MWKKLNRGITTHQNDIVTSHREEIVVTQMIQSDVRPVIFQISEDIIVQNTSLGGGLHGLMIEQIRDGDRSKDGCQRYPFVEDVSSTHPVKTVLPLLYVRGQITTF